MNEAQLKKFLMEQVVFLRALDQVMPGTIDTELVDFLENVQNNEWTMSLLLNALANAKPQQTQQQVPQNQPFKRAVG